MPLSTAGCADGWAHDDWFRVPLTIGSGTTVSPIRTDCSLHIATYYSVGGLCSASLVSCGVWAAYRWSVTRNSGTFYCRLVRKFTNPTLLTVTRVALMSIVLNSAVWATFCVSAGFLSVDGGRGALLPSSLYFTFFSLTVFSFTACICMYVFIRASLSVAKLQRVSLLREPRFYVPGTLMNLSACAVLWGYLTFVYWGVKYPGWGDREKTLPSVLRAAFVCQTGGFAFMSLNVIVMMRFANGYSIDSLVGLLEDARKHGIHGEEHATKLTFAISKFESMQRMIVFLAPVGVVLFIGQAIVVSSRWYVFLLHCANVSLAQWIIASVLSRKDPNDPSHSSSDVTSAKSSNLADTVGNNSTVIGVVNSNHLGDELVGRRT